MGPGFDFIEPSGGSSPIGGQGCLFVHQQKQPAVIRCNAESSIRLLYGFYLMVAGAGGGLLFIRFSYCFCFIHSFPCMFDSILMTFNCIIAPVTVTIVAITFFS